MFGYGEGSRSRDRQEMFIGKGGYFGEESSVASSCLRHATAYCDVGCHAGFYRGCPDLKVFSPHQTLDVRTKYLFFSPNLSLNPSIATVPSLEFFRGKYLGWFDDVVVHFVVFCVRVFCAETGGVLCSCVSEMIAPVVVLA